MSNSVELPTVPSDCNCVVRGEVKFHDLRLSVRTRLDAIAAISTFEGKLTLWLTQQSDVQHPRPTAILQIENASMMIRGLVASEDLKVLVKSPLLVDGFLIPDGLTDRKVLSLDGSGASLEFEFGENFRTSAALDCRNLGVERRRLDIADFLPPALGHTVVRESAVLVTSEANMPVGKLVRPDGKSTKPPGNLVELRDNAPGTRQVSISTCGGTVFGTVATGEILGIVPFGRGSNYRCPNTGTSYFPPPGLYSGKSGPTFHCVSQIPLLVRSATLEDPIGVLLAGSTIQIDGAERGNTTLISVKHPAVIPLSPAHFSVKTSDLKSCTPVDHPAGLPTSLRLDMPHTDSSQR